MFSVLRLWVFTRQVSVVIRAAPAAAMMPLLQSELRLPTSLSRENPPRCTRHTAEMRNAANIRG